MPSAAQQRTATGASAFAEYFYRAWDWSAATNDPALLFKASSGACMPCIRLIDELGRLPSTTAFMGGRVVAHVLRVDRVTDPDDHADYRVAARVHQGAWYLAKSSNGDRARQPARSDVVDLWVVWADGRWLVVDLRVAARPRDAPTRSRPEVR